MGNIGRLRHQVPAISRSQHWFPGKWKHTNGPGSQNFLRYSPHPITPSLGRLSNTGEIASPSVCVSPRLSPADPKASFVEAVFSSITISNATRTSRRSQGTGESRRHVGISERECAITQEITVCRHGLSQAMLGPLIGGQGGPIGRFVLVFV